MIDPHDFAEFHVKDMQLPSWMEAIREPLQAFLEDALNSYSVAQEEFVAAVQGGEKPAHFVELIEKTMHKSGTCPPWPLLNTEQRLTTY